MKRQNGGGMVFFLLVLFYFSIKHVPNKCNRVKWLNFFFNNLIEFRFSNFKKLFSVSHFHLNQLKRRYCSVWLEEKPFFLPQLLCFLFCTLPLGLKRIYLLIFLSLVQHINAVWYCSNKHKWTFIMSKQYKLSHYFLRVWCY